MTIKMKSNHFVEGEQIHRSSKTPFQGEKYMNKTQPLLSDTRHPIFQVCLLNAGRLSGPPAVYLGGSWCVQLGLESDGKRERAAKLNAGWLLAEMVTRIRSWRCPPGAPCSLRLRFGWTQPSLVSCLGSVEIVTSVKQKLRKIWYFPFRPWLLK